MEVHLSPEGERALNDLVAETGRPAGELVEEAVLGLAREVAMTRELLDGRYDDMRTARVRGVGIETVEAHFRDRSRSRRE